MGVRKAKLLQFALVFLIGVLLTVVGLAQLYYDYELRAAAVAYDHGNSYEAVERLKKIAGFPFSDARLHYNLGMALTENSNWDAAAAEFRHFADEAPDPKLRSDGYYMMAWIGVLRAYEVRYGRSNPFGQALEYLAEALRLNPDNQGAKNLYERIIHLLTKAPDSQDRQIIPSPGQYPGINNEDQQP